VSPSGSNGNTCNTAQTPGASAKQTITGGASCLSGGDTLIVQAGTYTTEVFNDIFPSGSAGSPTTIRAQTQGTAIIKPNSGLQGSLVDGVGVILIRTRSYITIDGLVIDMDNLFNSFGITDGNNSTPDHIRLVNLEIKNGHDHGYPENTVGIATSVGSQSPYIGFNHIHHIGDDATIGTNVDARQSYGLYFAGSNGIVENNNVHDTGGYCFHGHNNVGAGATTNVIRNNKFWRCGRTPFGQESVLFAAGGSWNTFYNNLVYDGAKSGVFVGLFGVASNNNFLWNNTISNNGEWCIRYGSDSLTIRNNICHNNGTNTITQVYGSAGTVDHNLLTTSALFVNPATGDYHLNSGASSAIDQGASIPEVGFDFEGNPRPGGTPAYDLGADERVTATAPGTYFVAKTGSDSNSCTSAQNIATPKLTIASALLCAQAGGGDNVYIRTGTYVERIDSTLQTVIGGTSFALPTLIAAYQSEVVTLAPAQAGAVINLQTPGYIIFDKLVVDAGNVGVNALNIGGASHHIRVHNSTLKQATQYVVVTNGDGVELLGNTIQTSGAGFAAVTQTGGTGLKVESNTISDYGGGGVRALGDAIVRGNTIRDSQVGNTEAGIAIGAGTGALVSNNLVYNSKRCLRNSPGANGVKFYNNTCYNNTTATYGGIYFDATGTTPSAKNNILYQSQGIVDDTGVATYGGNFCENAGTGCAVTGNPQFTNAGTGNFHLLPISTARDMGASLLADVPTDKDGTTRPINGIFDAGAFEELFIPPSEGTAPPRPFPLWIVR
jgi:hypothetical protein